MLISRVVFVVALITAPVAALSDPLFPGTDEGLVMVTGLNGAPAQPVDSVSTEVGDDVELVISRTDPALDGAALFLAAGFAAPGTVPTPTLPGLALDFGEPFVLLELGSVGATPTTLAFELPAIAAGLGIVLQAVAVPGDPATVSGKFASADGVRVDVALGVEVVTEDRRIAGNDTTVGDNFGFDVDVGDGRIAVGAPFDNVINPDAGSAYLFDLATGAQLSKTTVPFGGFTDNFGTSVALSGGSLFAGAPREDASTTLSGIIYRIASASGQLTQQILPSGSGGSTPVGHSLGEDIAVDGPLLVSGSRGDSFLAPGGGSVHVFDAASGALIRKLFPSDPGFADNFGDSVDVSGSLVVVGSPFDDDTADDAGAAYLFDATTGAELFKFTPTDTGDDDLVGRFVAIDGDTVLVGAPFLNDADGTVNAGAVYVYDAVSGALIARLSSPAPGTNHRFGDGLAIGAEHLLIGESLGLDSSGVQAGVIHVYDRTTLARVARLEASAGIAEDALGESIAVDGDTVVAGARGADDLGDLAGAAYVFTLP